MEKTAVVLFNLGGPDKAESIRPYLFNFFMDRNIIRLPLPARYFFAALISWRRSRKEAKASYGFLGGRSPLLENTRAQAQALQKRLGSSYKVFIAMRYWHPRAEDTAQQVTEYDPDRVVLLPLYPQFSTTTTWSSFQEWDRTAAKIKLDKPTSKICCYPFDENFIAASADRIKQVYRQALAKTQNAALPPPRVLFSAHGLPEDVIKDGDPYQWQCEQSAAKIAAATGIENLDWQICYQSRVGPKKWIGPSTEEALQQAAQDKVPVLVYPHAFVNEHVETLVEIEIEYRHRAGQWGVPYFERVPAVSEHPLFIQGLADMIHHLPQQTICPVSCRRCYRHAPDG